MWWWGGFFWWNFLVFVLFWLVGFFFFWRGEFEEQCCVKEFKILQQQKNSLTTLVFRYNGAVSYLLNPPKMLQCIHKNPNFDISNFSHRHVVICLILQFSKLRASLLPHCEKGISSWETQTPNISVVNN